MKLKIGERVTTVHAFYEPHAFRVRDSARFDALGAEAAVVDQAVLALLELSTVALCIKVAVLRKRRQRQYIR